jgi:hypothetical protein
MSFGRPFDHPVTDLLRYGKHPFPNDMEQLLRKVHALNSKALDGDVASLAYDWVEGKNLDEGRQLLNKLLVSNQT